MHDRRVREICAQLSSEKSDDDPEGGGGNDEQFDKEESGSEPATKSEWSSGEDTDAKEKIVPWTGREVGKGALDG